MRKFRYVLCSLNTSIKLNYTNRYFFGRKLKFNWSRCLEAMCKYFQYLQTWLIPSCKYVVKIFWNSIFFLWGLNSVYDLKQILMRRVCQSNTYKNLRYENRLHSKFMKEYTIIFTTLPMKREIGFLKFSRYLFSVQRYTIWIWF